MKLSLMLSVILLIAFLLPVSAETVGNLQKEERGIIVDSDYSQRSELLWLRSEIISKQYEIREFENKILPSIQWNIPPDIMTLDANGRLEGNFFLTSGGINGEFNAEASAKSESLYRDFDPYVSEEATKEVLLFARKLLEKNGTYSPAEQVLEIQLQELGNKGINESAEMHIFYVQKIYNSVVDIGNELDAPLVSVNNKLQIEQNNEDRREFNKLPFFVRWGPLTLIVVVVIALFTIAYILCEKEDERYRKRLEERERGIGRGS